jgi:predicted Zn-ribbon and HTH transcriptional regulator
MMLKQEADMYINELKINVAKLRNTIKLILGILGLMIFGATFVFTLAESTYETSIILFFLITTVVSAILICFSIKSRKLIESVYFYSRYFDGDLDGYIYTSEMTKVIGKSEKKINCELHKLINKKYLLNMKLIKKGKGMQVELYSNTHKCECKNCGAVINKKVEFAGVCPYCGSSDIFAIPVKKQANKK